MKRIAALILIICLLLSLGACGQKQGASEKGSTLVYEKSMPLELATQFAIDYYEGGYKLITLADGSRYLVVPEGKQMPKGLDSDIVPIYQPLNNIYMAATAVMSLFSSLDALDTVSMSGTQEDGWYIDEPRALMQSGDIVYAGKYSDPDYELMLSKSCPLAIESMMIWHTPEVKEKLEELGIAVFVDQASNETHPLGSSEWIKLYGVLLDKEELAGEIFNEQMQYLAAAEKYESTGKSVAFFYIGSNGKAYVRKSDDYLTSMIELAGGEYVFKDDALDSTSIDMETFFAKAKDADYIIYNSTLGGELGSIDDLLDRSHLLSAFKAVRNNNVWCTDKSMYQESTHLGNMIESFHKVFAGEADGLTELPFLYRIQ